MASRRISETSRFFIKLAEKKQEPGEDLLKIGVSRKTPRPGEPGMQIPQRGLPLITGRQYFVPFRDYPAVREAPPGTKVETLVRGTVTSRTADGINFRVEEFQPLPADPAEDEFSARVAESVALPPQE